MWALLHARAKVVDRARQEAVQAQIMAQVDKWENDRFPKVSAGPLLLLLRLYCCH